jgi:hypothetical protein
VIRFYLFSLILYFYASREVKLFLTFARFTAVTTMLTEFYFNAKNLIRRNLHAAEEVSPLLGAELHDDP